MVLNTEWAQVEVIDLVNDGSGLAFGIIGGRSTGVVVKTILPGGVADRDGRLQSGDHILQIGEVNLRGLGSEQVASVLRQCGVNVRMVVARPVDTSSVDYQVKYSLGATASIVPTNILGDPVELDRHLLENGYVDPLNPPSTFTPFFFTATQNDPISDMVEVVRDPLPIGAVPQPVTSEVVAPKMLPLDMALRKPDLPETETFWVELKKDDLGLGITVAGYVCEKEEISGIFVKSISKGSAADQTNIKVNDRIIEVDGNSVLGFTNHQAVELLRNTGNIVEIKLERYLRGPKYEQLQQAIRANELRAPSPPSPSASSLPKIPISQVRMSCFLGIEPESESRTSFEFDSAVLLECSPGNEEREIVIGSKPLEFSVVSSDSIYDKWREMLEKDVEIVIAQMEKEPNGGLGISLEGTVDVEDGKEVRPHHYIRNILPDGPVGKNALLQAGDELLEVNGIQLHGLNHLEVVSVLRQLPSFVCLVCARYAVPISIIDTAQRPDAFEGRKILAGDFPPVAPSGEQKGTVRLVKAKSETSIASSMGSEVCTASRSRSLEIIAGLPMWSDEETLVELVKGERGLGFSILDYQDPLDPSETVIVVRSLVPGGVAQADGRLIPGDRLISVNGVNLENATLDRAVQTLKGAPKGVVKITVAKPLNATDAVSHASQDTEEDQTCLEDFQECIEDFQECLDAVNICIDDDHSFNHSPCGSQVEDFGQKTLQILQNNYLNVSLRLDGDNSVKSTNDTTRKTTKCSANGAVLIKTESFTQSDKPSSEKDGYETCIDESLSEDNARTKQMIFSSTKTPKIDLEDITPTNSKINVTKPFSPEAKTLSITVSQSEPCLVCENPPKKFHQLFFDSKMDCELKEYDAMENNAGVDEFFLVEYPQDTPKEVAKCLSEPNVLETKYSYRRCIREYYNDYADCLELYKKEEEDVVEEYGEKEVNEIFDGVFIGCKSKSAPDIMDRSFITLTYDPGPEIGRRKSDFQRSCLENEGEMTVARQIDCDYGAMKGHHVDDMLRKHWGSTHTVEVFREPDTSLGISIVGGKVDLQSSEENCQTVLGIFVKNVVSQSPAGKTGQFKTGDRILEVSGVDLRHASHEAAVQAIRSAPNPVTFVVQSIVPWKSTEPEENPSNECLSPFPSPVKQKTEENHKMSTDIVKENEKEEETLLNETHEDIVTFAPKEEEIDASDSDEEEEDDDVRELEGRTVTSLGQQIDRASAGNVKRTKEEADADKEEEDDFGYTTNKVKKKYGNLGHPVLVVRLERGTDGLGLSLAGHRDRNCMAVFVCGLNPRGSAFKTGAIQVGDEILEVNGVVLHGRCHLNASAIIKGLSGPVFKVIILRRKTAIEDIAVKPITQFPISLAEEASEEQFSANYPNVRTVAIKKGAQSLGIMIIEGKHAEVGQGIFISDIQEGSSAEKAGLEIGEMILAVNKDPLVGSNYDTAANLLKRTEGLVTLVVSNPGKKEPKKDSLSPVPQANNTPKSPSAGPASQTGLKASATPSRPTTPVPEPPADPLTSPIVPGKDVVIEINTDNKGLGLFFVGGKDTPINNGIAIVEVYPGGTADKDGRLQPGDQILDVNGTSLKDATYTTASQALKQTLPKVKMTVYRPNNVDFITVDVELVKKPGKGLGLSVAARKSGGGVYVADIISGGAAELDGKIAKGDILVSVNGQSVETASGEEAGAVLKTATGRVALKFHRYKVTAR